jgi:N-acetylmuramoyl-L-alanine amidase
MNCALYYEYIKAVYNDKTWPNHLKPGVLAWGIAEQGENRFAINGMGELARRADNYHSLHQRPEMAAVYPCTYHLVATTEKDNNYVDFPSPADEIRGLHLFIHRPIYGNVDARMGSFEELLKFLCNGTPSFCPTKGYVERVLSFLPEAEMELRKLGWTPDDDTTTGVGDITIGYSINNGLLYFGKDPIPFYETVNQWKWRTNRPRSIIIHYTASEGVKGIASWFQNPKAQVSAHLLIAKTGAVVQFVPFHKPAWHSGLDSYNCESIGIELEGFGCSRVKIGNKVVFTKWNGVTLIDEKDCVYAAHRLEPRMFRWWPKFTNAQYDTLNIVVPVLRKTYGSLKLLGHDMLGVGKVDPGPAFDWNRIA